MMTQEEFMDVLALRAQGWTIREIAEKFGYHPATVSSWIKRGGPPAVREVAVEELVVDQRWQARIGELLAGNRDLLATSVERILRAEGFEGSYATLARYLREVRGSRRSTTPGAPAAPIETPPGQEAQFDWSDCCDWGERWGLGPLHCFGSILCWSRHRFWWFASSVDREHTFEGLVLGFEDAGGVPAVCRTDRMGALGESRGRTFKLHPPVLEFARAHGTAIVACQARDARRKGKIERPFRELKEAFLAEVGVLGPPGSIGELNQRAARWLADEVHARPHRTTGVAPDERMTVEREWLGPLPRLRFDTARRQPRTVGGVYPLIEWDGVPYSVPPDLVGQLVEVRQPVASTVLEVRSAGRLVATHTLAPAGSDAQWLPEHRKATETAALARHHSLGRPPTTGPTVPPPTPEVADTGLDLGAGDYEIAPVDLARYDLGCGCTGHGQ